MFISRRFIARAGALTLAAATFAACGDSTGPLNLSPDQLQSLGESMAIEIEGGALQLTAQGAMGTVNAPAFSLHSARMPQLLQSRVSGLRLSRAGASLRQTPTLNTDCGVPSQNPPTDSDGDQVPDNFSVTFALPACHFADADGSIDLTGVARVTDPLPGTAGMTLNFSLENFQIAISGAQGSGTIVRDGSASVAASETGLSQTHDWTESARVTGYPSIGVDVNWSATFAAAAGQTITAGQPLPDGVYQPNGSITYREGRRTSSFSVTTVTPLQYSASCAAGVANGTASTPFSAGEVQVAFSNAQHSGRVTITYADCSYATVQYVAQ
jgi:hypothetical protein